MKKITTLLFIIIFLIFLSGLVYGAIPASERAALIAFYNSTDGDNWYDNDGWKKEPLEPDGFGAIGSEGSWYGITVDADHVTIIHFSDNNLKNNLPSELGDLEQLKELNCNGGYLSGNIPPELGKLKNLEKLNLSNANFNGRIPPELGTCTKLQKLNLNGNQLTGPIPVELANLSQITELNLIGNLLTGSIPAELGNLSNLLELELGYNQLSGNIPPELGNLSQVTVLYLSSNLLTGSIPAELGNLSNLKELRLGYNQLSGNIPPQLSNLSNLHELDLGENQLSGPIPAELCNLSKLMVLGLGSNQLSGSIPAELGNLSNLMLLSLGSNQLSGPIPAELGNLSWLWILRLSGNHLTGSIPPELGNLTHSLLLDLSSNRLSGSIPPELGNLDNLEELFIMGNRLTGTVPSNFTNMDELFRANMGYNGLFCNDPSLLEFLEPKDPHWQETQTISPTNVSAVSTTACSVTVSWVPIVYTADNGGYRVYFSTNPGEPYTYAGITEDKTVSSYSVTGLSPGTTYYFVVRTQTDPHINNNNTVLSPYSEEVYTVTPVASLYNLTVQSSPDSNISIAAMPADSQAQGSGSTPFTLAYIGGTIVTLTAPPGFQDTLFSKWQVDGNDYSEPSGTVKVTMGTHHTAIAYYEKSASLQLVINHTHLNFGSTVDKVFTGAQRIIIKGIGATSTVLNNFDWTASGMNNWLQVTPSSGKGSASILVGVDPTGLAIGTYNGSVTFTSPVASNSPLILDVTLKVHLSTDAPFGVFSTPKNGSNVSSSVPFTGWALDDIELNSVKIYRQEGNSLVFIGSADFVEGARPDVEAAYPGYPMNYQAGWGYMMLTNFLPNKGNGSFTLHAKATDAEGHEVTLGSKTIKVDNANAVKPFGAIDTPTQGGNASGTSFVNWGWALTPQPNTIPIDGSTINVWVDGVNLGHPIYNLYRSDIAIRFPGYANVDGAIGFFYLDTTAFENGVHTIQWTATDSGGNTDGIGSRYFTIQNTGGDAKTSTAIGQLSKIPVDNSQPVFMQNRFKMEKPKNVRSDVSGEYGIKIRELEPLRIKLSEDSSIVACYQKVGDVFRTQPAGMSIKNNVINWMPGVAYVGNYRFVVVLQDENSILCKKIFNVTIEPKFARFR